MSSQEEEQEKALRKGKGKARENSPAPEDSDSDAESLGEDLEEASQEADEDLEPEHIYALYHCRHIEGEGDDEPDYYAFQIADATVRNYSVRVKSDSNLPVCMCREPGTCRHVQWLLDQLKHAGVASSNGTGYHAEIASVGLENICRDLYWDVRVGWESYMEETSWQLRKNYEPSLRAQVETLNTGSMLRERIRLVRDILATFSEYPPEDYRRDIFESREYFSVKEVLVRNDLEATISKLLLASDNFLFQFKALVPPNLRAEEYFRKMNMKAMSVLQQLDEYVETNRTLEGLQHDLIWCAQAIVGVVDSIRVGIHERHPLTPSSRQAAAKALISILHEVVRNRNTDVYTNSRISRRVKYGERAMDRNLYERLINANSPENPPGNAFILSTLQDLPEARVYIEDLERILVLLGEVGWGPAPYAYRKRLSDLIFQLKAIRPSIAFPRAPLPSPSFPPLSGSGPTSSSRQLPPPFPAQPVPHSPEAGPSSSSRRPPPPPPPPTPPTPGPSSSSPSKRTAGFSSSDRKAKRTK